MTKRLVTGLLLSWVALAVNAQWTTKDSLNLVRILNGGEDLKLNLDAVKQIDFGKVTGVPEISKEKNRMLPDLSLPSALPNNKPKLVLTLYPYKSTTRYDWDPVRQIKIKVGKDTWRGDNFYNMKKQIDYSNWAKTPMDVGGGYRRSRDEIEASGIRTVVMGERVNNTMVNRTVMVPGSGISLGKGVSMDGSAVNGLNLMRVFEKNFWSRGGGRRRARTLEVLESYGDSAVVGVKEAVLQPIIR